MGRSPKTSTYPRAPVVREISTPQDFPNEAQESASSESRVVKEGERGVRTIIPSMQAFEVGRKIVTSGNPVGSGTSDLFVTTGETF